MAAMAFASMRSSSVTTRSLSEQTSATLMLESGECEDTIILLNDYIVGSLRFGIPRDLPVGSK